MLAPTRGTTGNLFLDLAIGADDREICVRTRVHLKKGQKIVRDSSSSSDMYFPIDTLISLSFDLENGNTAEFRQIGREGFVGFSALMGTEIAQSVAVVQTDGEAYRVSGGIVQKIFENSSQFRQVTLQYMQGLMQEAAQSVICNRFHSISQQYSRSLLLAADRLGNLTVPLTHEQLAVAVGCRRESVSLAARKLQVAGVIEYSYGKVVIRDSLALKHRACECYDAIKLGFSAFFRADTSGWPDAVDAGTEGFDPK